ncbi:MarR family winged helix-turn-helix transcriptional regulator [Amycolatopsis sp. H20-H5]|uniref:MarR family winged helix-turn-helix transcriptional regulator n=1 Tax=Amycolatopsis sp. H20-H5 TaxID=3046309 RepID=UPI002DBEEC99|nr:MarR family transcriptional regulator [Amycolatopsis sp. H20-H5]MEC3980323.1 MarR family transcriptional regulator [Amycolatopsis sp. H20-H5]
MHHPTPEPDVTDTPDELAAVARAVREGVSRLNWRMRAERDESGPGPVVLAVLSRLYRAGTHTPKELSDSERIHPQSLTRILASLEERGQIDRRQDPKDGRRALIDVTRAGLAVLRDYSVRRERWLAAAMEEQLEPAERQLLLRASELMVRLADS